MSHIKKASHYRQQYLDEIVKIYGDNETWSIDDAHLIEDFLNCVPKAMEGCAIPNKSQRIYTCPYCHVKLQSTRQKLRQHLVILHETMLPAGGSFLASPGTLSTLGFKCMACQLVFKYKDSAMRHARRCLPNAKVLNIALGFEYAVDVNIHEAEDDDKLRSDTANTRAVEAEPQSRANRRSPHASDEARTSDEPIDLDPIREAATFRSSRHSREARDEASISDEPIVHRPIQEAATVQSSRRSRNASDEATISNDTVNLGPTQATEQLLQASERSKEANDNIQTDEYEHASVIYAREKIREYRLLKFSANHNTKSNESLINNISPIHPVDEDSQASHSEVIVISDEETEQLSQRLHSSQLDDTSRLVESASSSSSSSSSSKDKTCGSLTTTTTGSNLVLDLDLDLPQHIDAGTSAAQVLGNSCVASRSKTRASLLWPKQTACEANEQLAKIRRVLEDKLASSKKSNEMRRRQHHNKNDVDVNVVARQLSSPRMKFSLASELQCASQSLLVASSQPGISSNQLKANDLDAQKESTNQGTSEQNQNENNLNNNAESNESDEGDDDYSYDNSDDNNDNNDDTNESDGSDDDDDTVEDDDDEDDDDVDDDDSDESDHVEDQIENLLVVKRLWRAT